MQEAIERRNPERTRVPLEDVLVELRPEGFDVDFEADAVDLGLGGLAMRRAVGTSLVIISVNSSTGFFKHLDLLHEQGIALDAQVIVVISVLGVLVIIAGARISDRLPQARLKQYFGIFLIATGAFILWRSMPELVAA